MKTKFLNIDLEIYNLSPEQRKEILDDFGDTVVEMYNGPTANGELLSLELASNESELEDVLRSWAKLLSIRGPVALRLLEQAKVRLDIGIQAGTEHSTLFCIPPDLLWRFAFPSIEIAFTIYGYQEEDS